jgi:hypothetical protein
MDGIDVKAWDTRGLTIPSDHPLNFLVGAFLSHFSRLVVAEFLRYLNLYLPISLYSTPWCHRRVCAPALVEYYIPFTSMSKVSSDDCVNVLF